MHDGEAPADEPAVSTCPVVPELSTQPRLPFLLTLRPGEGEDSCELVCEAGSLRPGWQQHLLLVGNSERRWIWETGVMPQSPSALLSTRAYSALCQPQRLRVDFISGDGTRLREMYYRFTVSDPSLGPESAQAGSWSQLP